MILYIDTSLGQKHMSWGEFVKVIYIPVRERHMVFVHAQSSKRRPVNLQCGVGPFVASLLPVIGQYVYPFTPVAFNWHALVQIVVPMCALSYQTVPSYL